MEFNLTATQQSIVTAFLMHGDIYVVGGAVRDLLLGKKPKDIDLATSIVPDEMITIIHELGLIRIPDAKALEHGIIRVVDKDTGELIDVATFRNDDNCDGRYAEVSFTTNINEDLARRDLTINAMAAEITAWGLVTNIIDPFNGAQDIKDKTIRFVGVSEDRIQEDYLRMLRACRFTALDPEWKLTLEAEEAIKLADERIKEVSRERVQDEIVKAHKYNAPANFWRSIKSCELLPHIMPELVNAIGQDGGEYHNETVWEHLLATLEAACELTTDPMLRLACALHDVGKPAVATKEANGEVHFYKHEVEGASIVFKWMMEWKFSRKDAEYVSTLVRHHQWRFESNSRDRTIRRWLQTVGPHWQDLIILRCADRKGNFAKRDKPMITSKMRELMERAQQMIDSGVPIFKEDLAINGDDIKALGIQPGPVYKEIFTNLLGIVLNDPEKNKKEWLLDYVARQYIRRENAQD